MPFNKLLMKLANKLSENATIFKEIKSQSVRAFGIPELERVQLPSEFLSKLISYQFIAPNKLTALYDIYQNSNLDLYAKEEAYKYIEEFNFNNISSEGTKILKNIVNAIVLYPINTTEVRKLCDKVPFEHKTSDMQLDQKTSIMKLVELKLIHAFDINILYEVFMNNSNVVNNIIDPNWRRIKFLYNVYKENKRPTQLTRPSNIGIRSESPGQQPSPVEQYSPPQGSWGTTPRPPATEPIAMYQSPYQHFPNLTNFTNFNQPRYSPTFHSPTTAFAYNYPGTNSPELQDNSPDMLPNDDGLSLDDVKYDVPCVDMNRSVYPGECVIINIEKFQRLDSKDRIGSGVDVFNIRRTFEEMSFKVSIKENLTSSELTSYMEDRANDPSLYNVGVFVCFLMSHGEEGMISGSDGNQVEIDTIINKFKNDKCEALKGKPKVFFVQACRGNMLDDPLPLGQGLHKDNIETETRPVLAQPQDADLIVCQATTKGKVAVRTDTGSWYINIVCYVIQKRHQFDDLNTIHTKVNNKISKMGVNGASTLQVSNVNGSLRKKLMFTPNISAEAFLQTTPVLPAKFFAVQH